MHYIILILKFTAVKTEQRNYVLSDTFLAYKFIILCLYTTLLYYVVCYCITTCDYITQGLILVLVQLI